MTGFRRGFTLVELIVVIATIGILATITTIGLTRYQADTRDARRASSANVIAEALEKYYDANGEYPGCPDVSSSASTVTSTTLKGVSATTLVAPQADDSITNSISCTSLSLNGSDLFEYEGDGSSTCSTGTSCLAFKLKYKDESDGQIKIIEGRRNTDIDTAGALAISGSGQQFSSINLSWNTIQNAANYAVQRADDSGFTVNVGNTSLTGTSGSVTGLTPGSSYYVRMAPNASNGQGNWSNVLNVTVPHIATPSNSMSSGGPTSLTATWAPISGATSYIIQRDTSSSFTAPEQWTQSTANKTFSDSQPGLTHYFRVKATAPDDTSGWSATQSLAPTVPQPTSDPSMSAAMNGTNAEGTTSGPSCAYGTLEYGLHYHSENTGTLGSYSAYTAWGPTTVLSVGALQGYRYVFQSQARCLMNGTSSAVRTSAEASVVRPILTPTTPVLSVDSTSWYRGSVHYVNYISYCPSGTSLSPGPSYGGGFQSSGFNWSDGIDYYHGWGYGDSWTFASGYGSGAQIRYRTNYFCYTTYYTSPASPNSNTLDSYITIT